MSTIIITLIFAFLAAYINYGRCLFKKLKNEAPKMRKQTKYIPHKQETYINRIKRACKGGEADNPNRNNSHLKAAVSGWIPVLFWITTRSVYRSVRQNIVSLMMSPREGYPKVSRRLAAGFMAFTMMLSLVGGVMPVYAAEDFVHIHDAACGYIEGVDCTHECNEDCAEDCIHMEHNEECGYIEAVSCTYTDDSELNLTDEVDSCICEELCGEDSVNVDCPVCVEDSFECFHYYCYCETECTEDNINNDCPICKDEYTECTQGVESSEAEVMAENEVSDFSTLKSVMS